LCTLDGNENFKSVQAFRDFWEDVLGDPKLASLRRGLLFVEQPFHRDLALSDEIGAMAERWPARPPIKARAVAPRQACRATLERSRFKAKVLGGQGRGGKSTKTGRAGSFQGKLRARGEAAIVTWGLVVGKNFVVYAVYLGQETALLTPDRFCDTWPLPPERGGWVVCAPPSIGISVGHGSPP